MALLTRMWKSRLGETPTGQKVRLPQKRRHHDRCQRCIRLHGNFDRSRLVEVAKNAGKMFEGLWGLRFKAFTLDEKQQRAMNFYVWDSQEAAEAFFTDELRERVTGLYGVAPTVSFLEIAELVDNS